MLSPMASSSETSKATTFVPKDRTLAEYLAYPEANAETGACPNCVGRHYTAVGPVLRGQPSIYRCLGTESPNADGWEYVPPCGTKFRGLPGRHFAEAYFASFFEEAS